MGSVDPRSAFDFERHEFVPAFLEGLHYRIKWATFQWRHEFGVFEATRSHKVLTMLKNGRLAWIQCNRAVREQFPVIVRNPQGFPTLSRLYRGEEFEPEETMDVTIDHIDHALVCENLVTSHYGRLA